MEDEHETRSPAAGGHRAPRLIRECQRERELESTERWDTYPPHATQARRSARSNDLATNIERAPVLAAPPAALMATT
jgi:hypothetical protein